MLFTHSTDVDPKELKKYFDLSHSAKTLIRRKLCYFCSIWFWILNEPSDNDIEKCFCDTSNCENEINERLKSVCVVYF